MSPLCQDNADFQLPPSMATNSNFFDNAVDTNFALEGGMPTSIQPPAMAAQDTPRTVPFDQPSLESSLHIADFSQTHIPNADQEKSQLGRSESTSFDQNVADSSLVSTTHGKNALLSHGTNKVQKRGRKSTARSDSELAAPRQLEDLDQDGLPKDPRRRRVIERNRIAATKCRLRKRDEASALASREQAMEDKNRYLSTCFDSLTAEIYHLKTQLLRHTDCNCMLIQKYIANEAQRSVDNMVDMSQATVATVKQGDSFSSTYRTPSGSSCCEPPVCSDSPTMETFPIQWTNPFQNPSCLAGRREVMVDLSLGPFQKAGLFPDAMSAASSMPVTPSSVVSGDTYFPAMDMSQQMIDHRHSW